MTLARLLRQARGSGVVRAEHPGPGLQDRAVLGFGFFQPPLGAQDLGEVVAAGQGIGVARAEHPGPGRPEEGRVGSGWRSPRPADQYDEERGEAAEGVWERTAIQP